MSGPAHQRADVAWSRVDTRELEQPSAAAYDEDDGSDDEQSSAEAGVINKHTTLATALRCLIALQFLILIALGLSVLAAALIRLVLASSPPLSTQPPAAVSAARSSSAPSVPCTEFCHWRWQPTSPPTPPTDFAAADNREQVYSTYHTRRYDEFVCPTNFRNLADYLLSFPLNAHRQHAYDETPLVTVPPFDHTLAQCIAPASIVYAQAQNCARPVDPTAPPCDDRQPYMCRQLFHASTSLLHTPVIVITGQSDHPTSVHCPLALNHTTNTSHPLLVHWYGQNNDLPDHPQLSGLPIGVNCFDMAPSIRRVLTERWLLGRIGQCYGERRREVLREWVRVAPRQLVNDYMWRLDELKLESGDAARTGILHALLGADDYVQSNEFEAASADLTRRAWSSNLTSEDASSIASVMRQREAEMSRRSSADSKSNLPETLPCSALVKVLTTTAAPLDDAVATALSSSSPASFLPPTNVFNAQQALLNGKGKLAVANFGFSHPRRRAIWDALCVNNLPNTSDWLTCKQNAGQLGTQLPAVYDDLSQYLYWLAPQGNGFDTHRVWEALYLGAVPVMERLPITRHLFHSPDLPVLLVDDMTRLTSALLLAHAPRFLNLTRDYARRGLQLDHWKALIVGRQREYRAQLRASSSGDYQWDALEGWRCWGAHGKD